MKHTQIICSLIKIKVYDEIYVEAESTHMC